MRGQLNVYSFYVFSDRVIFPRGLCLVWFSSRRYPLHAIVMSVLTAIRQSLVSSDL